VLHGRAAELGDIHGLLADARAGRSSVLVICGEAGSGKTALLEHVASDAKDFRVLRCTGVESEAELPFAALHLLLLDCLDRLDALPAPQASALRAAFGLAEAPGVDRFLAGLATLTVLSEVAGDDPLLCLVDDAQSLDRESWDALVFAGRRLGAEGVVLLIAVRDDAADVRGLPVLRLGGLSQSAAAALLAERAADLESIQRDQLIEEAGGNPLALIELATALRTGDALTGGPPTVGAALSTTGRRVLDAFGSQVDRLPTGARLALLVAAAEDTGELGVVLAAADRISLGMNDFEPAESAGLVHVDNEAITFRHPLIRSAVYGRAPVADRITVHRALADALPDSADRRAWHLAAAAAGFDDEAADAMEAAARRADRRGGYAASSAAHERAARLTADPVVRGRRLAAGAMGARDSAQLDRAAALAQEASALTDDPGTLAKLTWVRARLEFERGTPRHASEMVLAGAETAYDCDREEAARMLIEVVRMAYFADEAPGLARAAELIDAVSLPADHPLRPMLAASSILARLQSGAPENQVPPLPPAVRSIRPELLGMTIGNLAIHRAFLLMIIGDADEAWAQTERMLVEARERGMIGGLPHILLQHAQAALVAGRLREALRTANEGVQIAEDTGQLHSAANLRGVLARITAMTGDEQTCVALADEAIHHGTERHSSSVGLAVLALAVLDLGFGRYTAALERLASLPPQLRRHPTFLYLSPPEWAEAAARSGQPERAAEAITAYVTWATHRDNPVVAANLHRCRALLGPDDEAEAHYKTAIRLYDDINRPMARARSELLYGEWLRRVRRRSEAREPLRGALRVFERIGADSWAERARSELRATGESVATAVEPGSGPAQLTPQELQVVRLAAAGLSNRDIGAQLFISPRTVGYHLYKAFPKLGVAGRHELAALDLP
jgi:DNA-binding CsgD family transcriptional regulator/tetratricopeptide (TPR) repeat protein